MKKAVLLTLALVLVIIASSYVIFAASGSGYITEGGIEYSYDVIDDDAATISLGLYDLTPDAEGNPASPVTITVPGTVTIDEKVYTVTAFKSINSSMESYINSISFPATIIEIPGNLYKWYDEKSVSYDSVGLSKTTNKNGSFNSPDTATVLSSIPGYIKNNYVNGAYYAGKTLVRVDPTFSGNFTVKEGTICVLAGAFEGCSSIGAVKMPDSVEFIGVRAFANSNVTSVNIPKNLKTPGYGHAIPAYAFYGCDDLTTVTIDTASIEKIGYFAFFNCSKLTGFDFTKVAAIESLSFAKAFDPAANVAIDLSKTSFDTYCWGNFMQSGIKSVTFGNEKYYGVDQKAYELFAYSTALTSINFADGQPVTTRMFDGCTSLTTDVLANSTVSALSFRCLANTGITEITIPASVTDLPNSGGGIFADNPQLKTLNYNTSYTRSGLPIFAIVNDCADGASNYFMSNQSFTASKPSASNAVYLTTINIGDPAILGTNNLSLQPYLETVNINCEVENIVDNYNTDGGVFQFCPSLKTVTFKYPAKVKSIGHHTFTNCKSLTSFPFEQLINLESIGENAFAFVGGQQYFVNSLPTDPTMLSYGLKNVDLSKCTKLTSIGKAAFQNQYNMTDLHIGSGVTSIHNEAFLFEASLKNLTIDCPLSAFKNSAYNTVYTPANAEDSDSSSTLIGSVFLNQEAGMPTYAPNNEASTRCLNASIENIVINGNGNLGKGTFAQCSNLKNVTINGNAELLPVHAFFGCHSLESVTAPNITTLGYRAFADCNIETVSLPAVTKMANNCFQYSHVKTVNLPALSSIYDSGSANKDDGKPIYDVFINSTVENVTLGKLTEVPYHTFYKATNLKKVELPQAKSFEYRAFAECSENLGDSEKLQVIAPRVNTIKANAFQGCSKVKEEVLPSLTTIEGRGFADSGIEKLVAYSLTSIGQNAFQNCSSLNTVSAANLVTAGERAFAQSGLRTLNAPKLTTIETNCFQSCSNLDSVHAPSLRTLNARAFAQSGLTSVTLPADVNCGAYVFQECANLSNVVIAEGRTELGDFMFDGCTAITSVSLPSTLTKVNWAAFKKALAPGTTLVIPASVTVIEDDAFAVRDYHEVVGETTNYGRGLTGDDRIKVVLMGNSTIATLHTNGGGESFGAFPTDGNRASVSGGVVLTAAAENTSIGDYRTYLASFDGEVADSAATKVNIAFITSEADAITSLNESTNGKDGSNNITGASRVYDSAVDDVIPGFDITLPPNDSVPTGGGGGSSSSKPAPATETISAPATANGPAVSATVTENKATVSEIKASEVAEVKAGENVTIDLSASKSEISSVELTKSTLENIASSNAGGMEVKLSGDTIVKLDTAALAAIVEQVATGEVSLELNTGETAKASMNEQQKAAVNDMKNPFVVDIHINAGDQRVSDFKGGSADVSVPYKSEKNVRAWYIDDNGKKTAVPCEKNGGSVVMHLGHNSYYVIEEYEGSSVPAFNDIEGHWAEDIIMDAVEAGYFNGISATEFGPDMNTSRGMIAAVLYRYSGDTVDSKASKYFTDIPDDMYYSEAIAWGYENGIMSGMGDGIFAPDENITREQLAKMLYGYAQLKGQGFVGSWMFLLEQTDADKVSDWANEAVHWCVMNKVISGYEDNTLRPQNYATRAEFAAMLTRFTEAVNN